MDIPIPNVFLYIILNLIHPVSINEILVCGYYIYLEFYNMAILLITFSSVTLLISIYNVRKNLYKIKELARYE